MLYIVSRWRRRFGFRTSLHPRWRETVSQYAAIQCHYYIFILFGVRHIGSNLLWLSGVGNIISKKQYGFMENYSTYMAIIDLVDKISSKIDNRKHSFGIFLDLSKAFDTIDHQILLRKLQCYGIRGIACDWFKSYLENRVQYVSYNTKDSDYMKIMCGVPQGSILGPLLFLYY